MKFILKNESEKINFWLVTEPLHNLIEKVGIGYSSLDMLAGNNELTSDEYASFILLQRILAERLGKQEFRDYFKDVTDPYLKPIKDRLLNSDDIKQYFIEMLEQHNSYFFRKTNEGIIVMIANKTSNKEDFPTWTLLDGDKLSLIIVDAIYQIYGYQDVNFNPIVNVGQDDFTLSNAFYALEQGY